MNKRIPFVVACLFTLCFVGAQNVASSPEYIKTLTFQWKGERFVDGRPKVSDAILERLKNVAVEEAWGYLSGHGYTNQFEGKWQIIHPDSPMRGRVVPEKARLGLVEG